MKHIPSILKRFFLVIFLSVIVFVFFCLLTSHFYINTGSLNSIQITYIYNDANIVTSVQNKDDIQTLKDICKGFQYTDNPSCGFSEDICIKFYNDNESIIFSPACDECSILRINNSNKYIKLNENQYKKFKAIVEKYGMKFPCV